MDLSNFQEDEESSSSNGGSANENSMEIVPSNRLCYYSPPTQRQNWSIPDGIIYYLAKNPSSPEVYQKLIQSCKYFFFVNPVIICSNLVFQGALNDEQIKIEQDYNRFININLDNISQQFWITESVRIDAATIPEETNIMASIIPHIYRCDAKSLLLYNQNISWNEYLFFAATPALIRLCEVIVKDENGSIVALEKLVEVAVKVKEIDFDIENNGVSVSSETAMNLLQISHFATITSFLLKGIPDTFGIETFFAYIKKTKKQTFFALEFSLLISDAYKNRLNTICGEIDGAENHDYLICFYFYPIYIEL